MFDRKIRRRFWEKVGVPVDEHSCWEWKAARLWNGYGSFYLNGKMQGAHRVAWALVNGPIPRGEGFHGTCVLHRCDNRACVRPEHLFLGTNADNVRDRNEKSRQAKGEAHADAKLTKGQVYAIRADPRLQREIAADYGVRQNTVSYIKTRTTWSHLPELAVK